MTRENEQSLGQGPLQPAGESIFRKANTGPLSPEDEKLRKTVIGVKEFRTLSDKDKEEFARFHLELLKRKSNRRHFVGVPTTASVLRKELEEVGVHGLAGINAIGEAVGFVIIRDAGRDQSDSFIEKLVILNSLQNKRGQGTTDSERQSKPYHVGHDFLEKVVEWGFKNPTDDGREREALHAATVMFVGGYERVDALFTHFFGDDEREKSRGGFTPVQRLENQARVQVSKKVGKKKYISTWVMKPTQRYALYRNVWDREQRLRQTS